MADDGRWAASSWALLRGEWARGGLPARRSAGKTAPPGASGEPLARNTLLLLAASLLTVALSGCVKSDPVRIGFAASLSGKAADIGGTALHGAILAVEEVNAAGGIDGRQVELVVEDVAYDNEKAAAAVGKIARAGGRAIIGFVTSRMTLAALPEAERLEMPLVCPTTSTDLLTGKDDMLIRVVPATKSLAAFMAGFVRDELGVRTTVSVFDDSNRSYTENWVVNFKEEFEARGGRVKATLAYTTGPSVPYNPLALKIAALSPELVLISSYPLDAAMLCQQLRKVGWKGEIATTEWGSPADFMAMGGQAAEGVWSTRLLDWESREQRFISFLSRYRERFRYEPGLTSAYGYEAAMVLMAGIAANPEAGGKALRDSILDLGEFQGLQEKIRIDRFGDAVRRIMASALRKTEKP